MDNATGYLEEFSMLAGFKFCSAYTSIATCKEDESETEVLILKFANDKHVMVEIVFIDGEYHIGEPYAIDNDYQPIDK